MTLVSIPANPVPEDVVSGTIKTPDGAELRFARWAPPAGRKGTVCVFTGRTEPIEKYFETVRDLRDRGFAVAMIRAPGHSSRRLRTAQGLCPRRLRLRGRRRNLREAVGADCPPPYFRAGAFEGGAVICGCACGKTAGRPHGAVAPMIDRGAQDPFPAGCAEGHAVDGRRPHVPAPATR